MKVLYCREFGMDCNAKMKGNTADDVVSATINHWVSMHKLNQRELNSDEKRAEITAKIKDE